MCELLGMSANVPTDICFSFAGLMQRGAKTGPHADGWGIAFYQGDGFREFKDPEPSHSSKVAELVRMLPMKSDIIIGHIRQANSGSVSLANTHPYNREMWGRNWCYAHNGQLKGFKQNFNADHYAPIGQTDSEYAFCWILNKVRRQFPSPPSYRPQLWQLLAELCDQLSLYGVFNLLLSDSKYLYCYCSTKLTWITRRAPFGNATLKDDDLSIDFSKETSPGDVVTIVATETLTDNETWQSMDAGEFLVFERGEMVYRKSPTLK